MSNINPYSDEDAEIQAQIAKERDLLGIIACEMCDRELGFITGNEEKEPAVVLCLCQDCYEKGFRLKFYSKT